MKLGMYYILNGELPVAANDLDEWATWIEKAERHVADETIGDYRISTVFLGLDHNYHSDGPPIFWESMVFAKKHNDPIDNDMMRCSGSWEQAEAMHARMVDKVKQHIKDKETK